METLASLRWSFLFPSLIPPSPVPSILMRGQEKDESFLTLLIKDPLRQKLAKTIKTTLVRCVCFLLKWITFIPTRSFQKFGRTFLYLKFQIKAQNNTGKFSLCFHVVNKMALGFLVAIGVVIAKLKSFLTVSLLPFWLEIQTALVDSSVDAAVVGLTLQSTFFYY